MAIVRRSTAGAPGTAAVTIAALLGVPQLIALRLVVSLAGELKARRG